MRPHRQRKAIIYLVTNTVNGKRYIGITSQPLCARRAQHFYSAARGKDNGAFHRALRKYPKDVFVWTIIDECDSYNLAVSEEIRLIAEMEPEYNSTKGGDGQIGRPISVSGRLRISLAHKGNTYHLGKKHSQETRERLRELAIAGKDQWKQYAPLGPVASSKRVLCVDSGVEFDSASAAARHYSVAKSAVIELCLGKRRRKTVGGHVFKYMEA